MYFPAVRATGFAGSRSWRRRGEYYPTGRRRIPIKEVSAMWMQGYSVREIGVALGTFKGVRFGPGSIERAIYRERHFGDPALFPIRRSADDGEPDYGVDDRTAKSLGL